MPSGALTKLTGRNQLSDERTNSVACSRGPRTALNVGPSGNENPPMNQVILCVADEDIAVEFGGVRIAAINGYARAGVDHVVADTGRLSRSQFRERPSGSSGSAANLRPD